MPATLGLVTMNHVGEHGHFECPFNTVGVADCATVQNPFTFLMLHMKAFSKFFSATLVGSFTALFVLILFTASILSVVSKDFERLKSKLVSVRIPIRELFVSPFERQAMFWFALHENSPAFTLRR